MALFRSLGRVTLSLVLASLLFLSGCAGMDSVNDMMSGITDLFADDDNADPPAVLAEDFKGELEPELLWSDSVGDGADKKYLKLIPVVRDNRVYVADFNGHIQARAVSNGDILWETKTDYNFAAGPGLGRQIAVMGTNHGLVVAYDLQTGNQKWQTTVSSEVLAVPVIANGNVIIRTTDGKIIALREADGGQIWSVESSVPALSIRGAGTPLVIDKTVIAGSANGKLSALQLQDGKVLWESTIAIPGGRSEVERLVDLDVDPIESRSSLYICSYQGGTSAVAKSDGEVLWRNEQVSSYSGISYDSRYLYISDNHGEVWQIDQRNGASLWKQKDLHNRQLSAAIVYGHYVVLGDFEGYLHWLSTQDGRLLARIKVAKAPIETPPVVVDDVVYAYAKDGVLAAIKIK